MSQFGQRLNRSANQNGLIIVTNWSENWTGVPTKTVVICPDLIRHLHLLAFSSRWPGNPDISRRIIENYALPAGDIDTILQLQAACAEHNQDFGSYTYGACAEWCMAGGNLEAAAQVLEAGLKDYPEALVCVSVCMLDSVCVHDLVCVLWK